MDIKATPKNVADLHQILTNDVPNVELPELTKVQLLRAQSAATIVRESEMAIDFEDPTEFGRALTVLAGWVLWGSDYNSRQNGE